jgi:membrane associated rhomboid family serine protease
MDTSQPPAIVVTHLPFPFERTMPGTGREGPMFPIGDDNTARRTTPYVTFALIVINLVVFFLELQNGNEFVERWAFIPGRFTAEPVGDAATVLTAMFMHGGWMHLLGNMLYLWIFGDNVEDRFGHVGYLLFYLVSGLAATGAQYAVSPHSVIPNVGASGAIAGVLGAYILMFPHAKVRVLVGSAVVVMPALIVLGLWIALQLFSGVGSIVNSTQTADTGGIAYMAHVGGFVTGFLLALILRPGKPTQSGA